MCTRVLGVLQALIRGARRRVEAPSGPTVMHMAAAVQGNGQGHRRRQGESEGFYNLGEGQHWPAQISSPG